MARYLIIGGVAGGATAAARLRRNDEKAEIIVFERGSHVSYANCGLPYYIGGVIRERDALFVQTPAGFRSRFNIDVRLNTEVLSIDRENRRLLARESSTGREYAESYDKVVLSPGAEPIRPPVPGIGLDGLFTLRSVSDTDRMKAWIDGKRPESAVIVGGGFIGLETAENLRKLGMAVTVVELTNQVLAPLDFEMAALVHQHLRAHGVELILGDGVASFAEENGGLTVTLTSGKTLPAGMAVLSIGVRPENRLAKEAGLEVGKTGGIVVDRYLRTNDPDIFAVGDAIEFPSPITRKPSLVPLAGPANKQGRIAADNIVFGPKKAYRGSIGTAIAKVFDLAVAVTGVNERILEREGISHSSVVTHSSSHAGYYPGSLPLSVKTVFDPETGKLLGAQIVGTEGVDKRIDLFAAVLGTHGTVEDLTEIEHSYAPPYSSAKDPVNIAGFVAENVLAGRSVHTSWREIPDLVKTGAVLIDVRTKGEFARGSIPGALNIPVDELRDRMGEIPVGKRLVIYCGVGLRAYVAERILRANGLTDVSNLSGGYKTWSAVAL